MRCLKNKKGFTLVELVVTIAILAVLGTIIGISASFFVRKANEKNQQTAFETAYNSIQSALVEKNSGFSTYGSLQEAFEAVLDDRVRDCKQYLRGEKYTAPTADNPDGYYIVCRPKEKKNPETGQIEVMGDEWSLDVLYYVKEGNLWYFDSTGNLWKNNERVNN